MKASSSTSAADLYLLDVNVLLALHRGDHEHHDMIRKWFAERVADGRPFAIATTVWASFLRLATSRRAFDVPATRGEAFEFLDAIRNHPHHEAIEPGPRHFEILRSLCDEGDASGDLVPDAVLAAIAQENACTIATLDRDFARFPSIRHVRPPGQEPGG